MTKLKGAFRGCSWCGGNGCMMCDQERRNHEQRRMHPIFSADLNDPNDMAALNRVFGRGAIESAFGPNGGGMREVEEGAAIESLMQAIRKSR
jgi:hypothetical protein